MTVCIAAMCETASGSPKIVFSADRLISAGLQFEHAVGKISKLTDYCYLMVSSNDSLRSDMIVKEVLLKMFEKALTIKEIAELFSTTCIKEMRKQQEHDILGPLGLTYDSFHQKLSNMPPELVREITTSLTYYQYKFATDFLIVGIDMGPWPMAHIYTVNQTGECKLHDYLGFAVIGSGYDLAFPELTKFPYFPLIIGWQDALIRVYDAKKVAERMGGVGQQTNLVVLNINIDEKTKVRTPVVWMPGEDTFNVLDRGIERLKKTEVETMRSVHEELKESLAKAKAQAKPEATTATQQSPKTDSVLQSEKVGSPEEPTKT